MRAFLRKCRSTRNVKKCAQCAKTRVPQKRKRKGDRIALRDGFFAKGPLPPKKKENRRKMSTPAALLSLPP